MVEYQEVEVQVGMLLERKGELETFEEDTYDPSHQINYYDRRKS